MSPLRSLSKAINPLLTTGTLLIDTIAISGLAVSYEVPILENPMFVVHVSMNHTKISKTTNVLILIRPSVSTGRVPIAFL